MGVWSSICQDKCRTRRRLRADLRITDNPHAVPAQYLASWLAVLKADKKAIFTAASKATEAAAFLAALQPYQPATQE